jgi:micrococcal nuclease
MAKQKKTVAGLILFSILTGVSVFFARQFFAFENIQDSQSHDTRLSQEDFGWNPSNEISNKDTALSDSDIQKEKNESSRVAQQSIVKNGIPSATAKTVRAPLSSQDVSVPSPMDFWQEENQAFQQFQLQKKRMQSVTAVRVIDGDTLVLSDKKTVRLIGINTPEKDQPYYAEAKDTLRELVLEKEIQLEKDISDTDRYGRLLRYAYVGDIFINLEMIKSGLAHSYAYPPDTAHQEEFLAAEKTAREQEIGCWKKSEFAHILSLITIHADAQGSDAKNLNDEYLTLKNTGATPLSLNQWSIKDAGTHSYTFPDFNLMNGAEVTLYSGKGINTQNSLYWNSKYPIWNNESDTLYMRTASGELVIEYTYP